MSKLNGNSLFSPQTVEEIPDDLSHSPHLILSPGASPQETSETSIDATFEENDPVVATGDPYSLLRSSLLDGTGELRGNLPTTPLKSAAEIGQDLGVSDRAVQKKFDVVSKAFPWIPVEKLRQGTSNYTRYLPLGQYLIQHQHKVIGSQKEWMEKCLKTFADKLQQQTLEQQQAEEQQQQLIPGEIATNSGNSSPGGGALALPVEQGEFVDEILGQIAQRNSGTSLSLELGQAIVSNKAAKLTIAYRNSSNFCNSNKPTPRRLVPSKFSSGLRKRGNWHYRKWLSKQK